MIALRHRWIAVALLAVSGCAAPTSSDQPLTEVQPAVVVHADDYSSVASIGYVYDGLGYSEGYEGYTDESSDGYVQSPIFQPSRDVTCDLVFGVCYDRFGADYFATGRYIGARSAERSVDRYGEQVFLFSPRDGVSCDRRTELCTDAGGLDRDLTDELFSDGAEPEAAPDGATPAR